MKPLVKNYTDHLLEQIRDTLCCINSSILQTNDNEYPSDPTWFCEEGVVTGGVIYVLDENLNVTPVFIDESGIPSPGQPAGNPCVSSDYEYKNVSFCMTDSAGNFYTKEICRTYSALDLIGEVIVWHMPDGSQTTTTPPGALVPCESLQQHPIDVPLCANN